MAELQQDLLGLSYSTNFEIQGLQEADVNLQLSPATGKTASVFGQVTDGTSPIPNATVKLFDEKGLPFQHTLTDESGNYALDGVPAGTYSIAVVKTSYRVSDAVGLSLSVGDTTEINLRCTADATLSLGAIAGTLTLDGTDAKPLGGAKITLFTASNLAIASTYTADVGEFVFYDVADGVYTLLASAEGYLPAAPMTATIANGSIANLSMTMRIDSRTYAGTVSGTIRDQSGTALAGCFVGLYRIEADGHETLVATTKTNSAGNYLFGDVSGGQYLVKAKLNK